SPPGPPMRATALARPEPGYGTRRQARAARPARAAALRAELGCRRIAATRGSVATQGNAMDALLGPRRNLRDRISPIMRRTVPARHRRRLCRAPHLDRALVHA